MKLLALLLATVTALSQNIYFQDPVLKSRLVNFQVASTLSGSPGYFTMCPDANHDGEISMAEASAVYGLDLTTAQGQPQIYSLTGLAHFPNLKWLRCTGNQLAEIGQLGPLLEVLEVENNVISSLGLQDFPALRRLSCGHNPIAWIDLDEMWNLRELSIRSTLITELDARMTGVVRLDCGSNPSLAYVNIQNGITWNSQKASGSPIRLDNLPSLSQICLDPGDENWLSQSQWNPVQTNVYSGPNCSATAGR